MCGNDQFKCSRRWKKSTDTAIRAQLQARWQNSVPKYLRSHNGLWQKHHQQKTTIEIQIQIKIKTKAKHTMNKNEKEKTKKKKRTNHDRWTTGRPRRVEQLKKDESSDRGGGTTRRCLRRHGKAESTTKCVWLGVIK